MATQAGVEDLVAAASQGSREALESLVRQIQRPVYGLALRMLFFPADAEDAAQEILIKVITNLKGFRGEGPFMAWALRIAANHLKGMSKSRAERREIDLEKAQASIDQAEAQGWFSRPLDAPRPLVEMEMCSQCVQALLQALDRPHRLAYVLASVMEVRGEEGAFIMEVTPATYRKRVSRARQKLKDFLMLNCGLFGRDKPCRCHPMYEAQVARGWLDPNKPVFVSGKETQQKGMTLLGYMREMDELGRVSAMFKAYPRAEPPEGLAGMIKELLDSKKYRVLSDPQLM